MSQVLETEYKKIAQEDPQLWDRIEAGLAEKPISVTDALSGKTFRSVKEAGKRKHRWTVKQAGLIAACLCVLLSVPALFRIGWQSEQMALDSAPIPIEGAVVAEDSMYFADEAAVDEGMYDRGALEEVAGGREEAMDMEAESAETDEAAAVELSDEEAEKIESVTGDHPEVVDDRNSGGESSLSEIEKKDSAGITSEDIRLLMNTAVQELNRYFGIDEDAIHMQGEELLAATTMDGISFCYGGSEALGPDAYLKAVYLRQIDEKGTTIPIGYTIEDILSMPEWGKTEVMVFSYTDGQSDQEILSQGLQYTKDGLHYEFRIGEENRYLPEGEQDLTIKLAIISKQQES